MSITVNSKAMTYLFNEKSLNNEIIDYLNDIIQREFEKENPDCDLIDECIDAIDLLEKHDELTASDVTYRRIKFKSRAKRLIAAALVAVIAASTLYATVPAFANRVNSLFDLIKNSVSEEAESTPMLENISSIYVTAPESADAITEPEDINEGQFIITAVLQDGTKREIPVSACKITKAEQTVDGTDYILVTVSYGGCACTIAFEKEVK